MPQGVLPHSARAVTTHRSFSATRRPENNYPSSQVRTRLTRTSEQLVEVIMKHQTQKELKLLRLLVLNFEKSRLIQEDLN